MKSYLLLLLLSFFISLASYSAPVNYLIKNNGAWNKVSSWSLGRLPINLDTVVIPDNMTVKVTASINNPALDLIIKVYGTVKLQATLSIGNNSIMYLYTLTSNITLTSGGEFLIGGIDKFTDAPGTIYGPAFADKTTGESPNGFQYSPYMTTLSVKFISFTLTDNTNSVTIKWTTAEEANVQYFIVEKSYDGMKWQSAGEVFASGNGMSGSNYQFNDYNTGATVLYYRIKEVNTEGKYSFTETRTIKRALPSDFPIQVLTNAGSQLIIKFDNFKKEQISFKMFSLSGQLINQVVSNASGEVRIDKKNGKGIYVLSISNGHDINKAHTISL